MQTLCSTFFTWGGGGGGEKEDKWGWGWLGGGGFICSDSSSSLLFVLMEDIGEGEIIHSQS